MTTTIPSRFGIKSQSVTVTRAKFEPDEVHIRVDGPFPQLNVSRRLLIADLSSELGVLIIDSPKVPLDSGDVDVLTMTDESHVTAEEAEMLAAHYANLAAKKRKVPPVDEQQVEALEALLNETSDGHSQSAPTIARRLIATGKVTVQS